MRHLSTRDEKVFMLRKQKYTKSKTNAFCFGDDWLGVKRMHTAHLLFAVL